VKFLRARTIRGRITVWSVVVAAILMSAAAFVFRGGVDTIVASSTRSLLASDGAPYEASIRAGRTRKFDKPGDSELIAVISPSGDVRVNSLPDGLSSQLYKLLQLDAGDHVIADRSVASYDVANEPVTVKNGTWHLIEARNRDAGQIVLNGLTLVLAIGVVLLVIGFGLSAWIVTGLALRPVTRMRQQASRLTQASTDDILPVGPVPDELSALAETLNEFITSVRSSADRERQMVADASHELRTPVAVLRTQLQLAHISTGDARALEEQISAAELTVDRLANLSTNLLMLSRIEAGDVAPQAGMDALLAEFLRSMDRAVLLGSSHSVRVDFVTEAIDEGIQVPIVPADFAGLVDNLVTNAIAASPRGSVVDVRLALDQDRLVLTVEDTGVGIPDDFLPVAFDRFTRADSSRPRALGGSGLGLAIVRAIAVRSGGDARLEQRKSGGVRAVVDLPTVPR
jgi:two-component system OmpR family sensor kinase